MKCFKVFCTCCVLLSILLSVSLTSYATESVDSSDYYALDPVVDEGSVGGSGGDIIFEFPEYTVEDPLPVEIIEEESSYDVVRSRSRSAAVLVIGDVAPDNPLFYGSGWITGTDSNLGTVTLYFPISYKSGYWGIDSNGYLFNVSSTSISGYLEDAYNNSVSASGFSYPRYREDNSYDYTTLYLRPENSNMEIAVASAPRYSVSDLVPYVLVFIGGVIVLCFMKRS